MKTIAAWLGVMASLGVGAQGAMAQVIPDGTLSTTVTQSGNNFTITNGNQVGNNLFHSFSQFSVPTGGSAFFNHATTVQNIFARVTGGSISNIDGLIRANGSANLFLLNPAGILFGRNAQLNIGGSFVASTANSILFADGVQFSATNPQATPLLTVSVPIGLQMGTNPAPITVQGNSFAGLLPAVTDVQLAAPLGVALVGGDVSFSGGVVGGFSGRLEVGSVANGMVGLLPTPGGMVLDYSGITDFRTLALRDRSALINYNVANNPLAGIYLNGGTVTVERSQLASVTTGSTAGSPIVINARNAVNVGGSVTNPALSSWITSQVIPGASGAGGAISLTTPQLTVTDGGRIQSLSLGSGTAGDVSVTASAVQVSGFAPLDPAIDPLLQNTNSRISSDNLATGAGGTVRIKTGTLTLLDGGQIGTLVAPTASGQGGDLVIEATGTITGSGTNPFNPFQSSGLFAQSFGAAAGGNMTLSATDLSLSAGSNIFSLVQGTGQGGNITADVAQTTTIDGVNPVFPVLASGIAARTLGSSNSGNLRLSTNQLRITGGGLLGTGVFPPLNAPPGSLAPTGNAGDVAVVARESIDIIGNSPLAPADAISTISSLTFAAGNAGNVTVSTQRLRILDGGLLISGIGISLPRLGAPLPGAGTGQGGNLTVNASDSIDVIGVEPFNFARSSISTFTIGTGRAGNAVVNTRRLTVQDGALVNALTVGPGTAGQLNVNATESILVRGTDPNGVPSQLSANALELNRNLQGVFFFASNPTGNTGSLNISTPQLTVTDRGNVGVQHDGTGNASSLQINAGTIRLDNGGRINASTKSGEGGNINLQVSQVLLLRNGSQISATAGGSGNGGNITINAPFIVAVPSENSDIIANAFQGRGGNIQITTQGIFGLQFRPQLTAASDITASSQFGVSGNVQINTISVDPNAGLVELPANVVDPSQQIATGCAGDQGSSFIATGRGGVPQNPTQQVMNDRPWDDVRDLSAYRNPSHSSLAQTPVTTPMLIQATRSQRHPDGSVELVADQTPAALPAFANCSGVTATADSGATGDR